MMGLSFCLSSIPRKWKTPRLLIAMFIIELPFSIAGLALFGISSPDLYRTRFWKQGSDLGWNSNPNQAVYAAANYRSYSSPLPWSQFTTNFNVVISVLSVFILLCKAVAWIIGVLHPLISLIIHAALVALWAVAIHNQAAPDMSDPKHPQPGAPWYITKSCGPPIDKDLIGYCKQAKGAFAVTVLMCALFLLSCIVALISLYPDKEFRNARSTRLSDRESQNQAPWEMMQVPGTPGTTGGLKSPTTPRTTAFNQLSGHGKPPVRMGNKGIPLRHHIAMGEETYAGSSRR